MATLASGWLGVTEARALRSIFPPSVNWKPPYHHELGGNHVVGNGAAHGVPNGLRRWARVLRWDEICPEARYAGSDFDGDNGCLLQRATIKQGGLHLGQLDSKAADFYLEVFSAQVFQASTRRHHAQITREVDSRVASIGVG